MPRSLVSFWKRVATSGPTVDGRVITPQELRDIAETYSTATYTAKAALKALLENPITTMTLAGALLEEYSPDVEVIVKKPSDTLKA
ncbi:GPO family capsid scaffolding protein [Pseudomonas coronafaciens]|uniref:GPO family capsid scaffolding protein n=1 Tax=Pseudomonas coronafaciens TaxID=53409 RepID=UPI000EFDFB96|nr:putative phage tail assembly chaperone [Pseudomonas coronafaciens]